MTIIMKIISCLLLVLTLSFFEFCEPIALEDNYSGRGSSSSSSTTNSTHVNSYDISTCCSYVYGSCKKSCENLSLLQLATTDTRGLGDIRKYCPNMQIDFWSCMNRTLQAIERGSQWSGRRCCSLALAPKCQNSCATSSSKEELTSFCRKSDEQSMYQCFEQQENGDICCSSARTSECFQACLKVFEKNSTHYKKNQQYLKNTCNEKSNPEVYECIEGQRSQTPLSNSHQNLACCNLAPNPNCNKVCKKSLQSNEDQEIILDELEAGECGPVLPHEPFWQCLFQEEKSSRKKAHSPLKSQEVSQINQIGLDSAKLHCCNKASTYKCKKLCLRTFSNDWTASRQEFEFDCLFAINELSLRQCIDEVEEPCQLGCDGLSFCTNFNNRPTELFRSCNTNADMAARSDIEKIKELNYISLPGIDIPIKNVSKCAPDKWISIACILQLKPCTRTSHLNQICREDCYEILNECMDWTRMNVSVTADEICSNVSPSQDDVPCISLKPYLAPSEVPVAENGGHHGLTSLCKHSSCNRTDVCIPNRNEGGRHQCSPSCTLGEASSYRVPVGSYVRVPVSSNDPGCFKICKCSANGRIEHCQPLPCFSYDSCFYSDRMIPHSTSFYIECNLCSCFAGELICTKKQCRIPGISDYSFTSLPCNCGPHYIPVCGKRNGITYPSACIAKCNGVQEENIIFGACRSLNPCRNGTQVCPSGTKCYEDYKTCLSVMHEPCNQYQCVDTSMDCPLKTQPVCDTRGKTHPSLCHLAKTRSELAYHGPCYRTCSLNEKVCGINGITYKHECEAWSDFSLVDYSGKCMEIGLIAADMGPRCNIVKCPKLSSQNCISVTPPGACCPVCGKAFRIVYSRKQVDRALYALKGKNFELLSLRNILKTLDGLLEFAECQLAGYLTVESDIFIVVTTRRKLPTPLQIEACAREAEKMRTLIENKGHSVMTNLALSALTVAIDVAPNLNSASIFLIIDKSVLGLTLVSLVFRFL